MIELKKSGQSPDAVLDELLDYIITQY